MARLNQGLRGGQNFQSGLDMLKPSNADEGLSPEYQKVIDQIRSNATYYGNQGAQQAQALAAKRGLTGSSIEQFGTQTALDNTNRAAADEESQVQLANLQRRQSLQDASAKALLDRASLEGSTGSSQDITGANLTSDEIASQRNMQMFNDQLTLQGLLGQQGIDLARDNMNTSADIANKQANYNLIGSVAGGALPYLLPKIFGSSGGGAAGSPGFLSSLFGGGAGAGATGAGPGGIPLAGAANGPLAGFGGLGGLAAIGGAGIASAGISKWLAPYLQKSLGTTGGGAAGFLLNPIGSQLNSLKGIFGGGNVVSNVSNKVTNAVSSVGNAVSNIFPF